MTGIFHVNFLWIALKKIITTTFVYGWKKLVSTYSRP